MEIGLRVLALNAGAYSAASEQLADAGLTISASVLRNWSQRTYVDKYAQIQRDLQDEVNQRVASRSMDIAARAAAIEDRLMNRLEDDDVISEIPPKDLAKSLTQVSQAKGINVEKAALLRGQPTQIHEVRGKELADELRLLKRLGVIDLDESDYEELGEQ